MGNSSILSLQKQLLKFLIYLIVANLLYRFRCGFRTAATSKMELFMILVNGFHAFDYYHKVLHLGYCSRPGSASEVGISFVRDSGKYSSQNQCQLPLFVQGWKLGPWQVVLLGLFPLLLPPPPLDFTTRCITMEFWYVTISIRSSGKCFSTKAEDFAVTSVFFQLLV